ncbi:MAG: hypothetical protein UR99_C0046G0008 [Candidatus Moranbacteria bacterium GW2011_GWD2_36_12]|nr:MAG: hypothetical protein UR99_C0046G0008 [Candidatus Moranbacteria bacterium GW2011_GWD2_36_12]KKQ04888.1 MAG: hypothetical protein US16_C0043G0008 [Candidatus Moranbacteria bacterium GW2011_GWE2_36_40]
MTTKKPEKNKKIKTKKEKAVEAEFISSIESSVGGLMKYSPENEKEEKELLLIRMIRQAEDRLDRNLLKIDELKFRFKKNEIENEIHEKVLTKNPKMKETWKYRCMEESYFGDSDKVKEIEDSIVYDEAWIGEAKKMITTKRYQDLPKDFFDFYHFDGEDISLWGDNEDFFDDMCDEEDCPICGKFDGPSF